MSYLRRFTKTISVSYSGQVWYPKSDTGGYKSYSGTTTETVHFEVYVNTDPFDEAIEECKDGVDLLTGSVVATETAHVGVIDETSRQVGDTIIAGFFKTVQSDISQQIAALKTRSESLLLQMNKLAQRCRDKQRQMGTDYQRISERYNKIFTDLNNELENRIYSIDEPVFHVSRSMETINDLSGKGDNVATVSITSGETSHVYSMLAAGMAKRRAAEAIEKGREFLAVQYATDRVIDKCLYVNRETGPLMTPFCVMEASSEKGVSKREVFKSPILKDVDSDVMAEKLNSENWDKNLPESEVKGISDYFNQAVATQRSEAHNEHDNRVADMTARLFNLSQTVAPGK